MLLNSSWIKYLLINTIVTLIYLSKSHSPSKGMRIISYICSVRDLHKIMLKSSDPPWFQWGTIEITRIAVENCLEKTYSIRENFYLCVSLHHLSIWGGSSSFHAWFRFTWTHWMGLIQRKIVRPHRILRHRYALHLISLNFDWMVYKTIVLRKSLRLVSSLQTWVITQLALSNFTTNLKAR